MLVKFVLELDALDGNVRADDLITLGNKWRKFGILVHPTDLKDREKIDAVSENLEQNANKQWQLILAEVRKRNPLLRLQPLSEDSFD